MITLTELESIFSDVNTSRRLPYIINEILSVCNHPDARYTIKFDSNVLLIIEVELNNGKIYEECNNFTSNFLFRLQQTYELGLNLNIEITQEKFIHPDCIKNTEEITKKKYHFLFEQKNNLPFAFHLNFIL